MKKIVYERSIKYVPRLYSGIKFIAGFMLYVPIGKPEDALKQVKTVDRKLNSYDETMVYL